MRLFVWYAGLVGILICIHDPFAFASSPQLEAPPSNPVTPPAMHPSNPFPPSRNFRSNRSPASVSNSNNPEAPDTLIPIGVKVIKSATGFATLYGGGYKYFESDLIAIGGVVYSGQISMGATGSYSLAGLEPSFISSPGADFHFEFSILIGAAGGSINGTTAGGFIIDPSLGCIASVGKNTDISIKGGYHWDPNNPTLAGPMFDLSIYFLH